MNLKFFRVQIKKSLHRKIVYLEVLFARLFCELLPTFSVALCSSFAAPYPPAKKINEFQNSSKKLLFYRFRTYLVQFFFLLFGLLEWLKFSSFSSWHFFTPFVRSFLIYVIFLSILNLNFFLHVKILRILCFNFLFAYLYAYTYIIKSITHVLNFLVDIANYEFWNNFKFLWIIKVRDTQHLKARHLTFKKEL